MKVFPNYSIKKILTPISVDSEKAQREYLLRFILLANIFISGTAFLVFLISWALNLIPMDMPIASLSTCLFAMVGVWLSNRGKWHIARYIPIIANFFIALYITYVYNSGVVSGTMFLIVVFITAILIRDIAPWVVALLGTIILIGRLWLTKKGYLSTPPEYSSQIIGSSLAIVVIFFAGAFLLHFFASSYRKTLDQISESAAALENRNIALKQQIEVREKAELDLAKSLDEKNLLLKEVHHRVKNNLQIINSLLYLQAHQSKDKQLSASLIESRDRIQSMAFVHEQLYSHSNFAEIDSGIYLRQLANHLAHTYNRAGILMDLDIDHIPLSIDEAIPIGLMVNELVTNAYKYAFSDGKRGKISIRFKEDESGIRHLSVQNTGSNLSDELLWVINGQLTDETLPDSLGINLVRQLSKQIGYTFNVTQDKNRLTFNITQTIGK